MKKITKKEIAVCLARAELAPTEIPNRAQLAAEFCGLGESIPDAHKMMAELIAERVAE